jgi:serine/threonine protein kinase
MKSTNQNPQEILEAKSSILQNTPDFIRTQKNKYKIVKETTHGKNALVYIVENLNESKSKKYYIAKKQYFDNTKLTPIEKQRVYYEEIYLNQTNNLLDLEWVTDSERIIIEPYYPGLTLQQLAENQLLVTQQQRVNIVNKGLDKLCEIHKLGWLHADIQPSNMIIDLEQDENQVLDVRDVTLIDFGHALPLEASQNILTIPMNSKINPTYYGYYFTKYLKLSSTSKDIPFSKEADFYAMGGVTQHALALSKNSLHAVWAHPVFKNNESCLQAFRAGTETPLFQKLPNKH